MGHIMCSNIGVSETTSHRMKYDGEQYEVRVGIAILGMSDMNDDEMREARFDPFHENWHDNYASGKGSTKDEAVENMHKDIKEIADSLWV